MIIPQPGREIRIELGDIVLTLKMSACGKTTKVAGRKAAPAKKAAARKVAPAKNATAKRPALKKAAPKAG